jgi:hypothetical protein
MPLSDLAATARRMWLLYEPVHALTYFSDETTAAYKGIGLKGFWQGYFASRVAPMGPVGAEVCSAVFYNFHPDMVAKALPSAWELVSPADVLRARDAALAPLLTELFGEGSGGDVAAAADLAVEAATGCDVGGRALYAGHAAVALPDDPVLRLWWATTLLREHRGDGHVAALVDAGIDGLEAHVLLVATGSVARERMQLARSWGDDDWDAAEARLAQRGLVAGGTLTHDGQALRDEVEQVTDQLAVGPWAHLGAERTEQLATLLHPLRSRVLATGRIPGGNPIGLPVDDG